MIQYIKRKDLDIEKYNACIKNARNSRIYALSSFLDIVANNWSTLVLNDYEAVMPIPWRSKYFLKYIYPPCWTQQLGVFSSQAIDSSLVDDFLKFIPKIFLKTTIQLNSECQSTSFSEKVNYTLALNKSYLDTHKNYRKDRKDRLKKFIKSELKVTTDTNAQSIIDLFKDNYTYSDNLNVIDYKKLDNLSKVKSLNPIILKIHNQNNQLISGSVFFKDHHRIYYLFSANNKEGNKIQGNTAILDHLIKEYSETECTLDFEGSMIPGIASFFKSFGSEKEMYYLYTKKF